MNTLDRYCANLFDAQRELIQAGQNLAGAERRVADFNREIAQADQDIEHIKAANEQLRIASGMFLSVKETNPIYTALIRPLKLGQKAIADLNEFRENLVAKLGRATGALHSAESEFAKIQSITEGFQTEVDAMRASLCPF